jgi:U3 small nucleolar RNA-associated protein 10
LNQIVRTLGRFSINYYGHLFDYYVGFLEYCLNTSGSATIGKRSASTFSDSTAKLHSLILESLDLLFIHDKKGFVDTVRFERILKPLANQLKLQHVAPNFFNYAQIRIIPTLLSLTSLVQDDFMWKSILFQICTQFRNPMVVVRKTITTTAMKLIDLLQDKFVIILNDFIPFLSEMLDDEEPEVCTIAKGIVKQLGQYSSEDIFALIKGSY